MINSSQAFLDQLEQWVKAVRQDDFSTARLHAEHLVRDGELMADDPHFRQCFAKHGAGFDVRQALLYMCQFLVCATEGRARVLKQYVKDHKPKPGA